MEGFSIPSLHSVCVVASICVALLLDGAIILYGCLVWAEDSSPASYTVAVLTFAVCFSLPVVLIGVFLVTISSNISIIIPGHSVRMFSVRGLNIKYF